MENRGARGNSLILYCIDDFSPLLYTDWNFQFPICLTITGSCTLP